MVYVMMAKMLHCKDVMLMVNQGKRLESSFSSAIHQRRGTSVVEKEVGCVYFLVSFVWGVLQNTALGYIHT